MRVLIAGGVFRLDEAELKKIQPAPEQVLRQGLEELDVDVYTIGLKDLAGALRARYDIVHVHHMSKMAVTMALRSSHRMVFTHHASTYGETASRRAAEQVVWRRTGAVVALSQSEAREKSRRFPYLEDRLHVIGNSVQPLGREVTLRRIDPQKGITLAFVGKLNRNKRPDLAINALCNLDRNVNLELTYHESPLEPELRQLVKAANLSDRVNFLGQAQGDELAGRYRNAEILILTSEFEALPSVVYEALMSGCPVVARDVGGIAEQIADAGILVPKGISDYAPYVRQAIKDYSKLADAAFRRGQMLRDSMSPIVMAREHMAVYRQLLEEAK